MNGDKEKEKIGMFREYLEEYLGNKALQKYEWKIFREKVPQWQENYMEKLNQEYIALLSGEGSASDRFWEIYKRQKTDKRCIGVQIEMNKSKMVYDILSFIRKGIITVNDLDGFSENLQKIITDYMEDSWN